MLKLKHEQKDVAILGAGVTGLSAAYALQCFNKNIAVVEKDRNIGGLARTIEVGGFRFDLGGHRFHTNNSNLNQFVIDVLGDHALSVPRSSKIYLGGQYVQYPLRAFDALKSVGYGKAAKILYDYLCSQVSILAIPKEPKNLEEWITSRFGHSLFEQFFKTYSEKVWGIPCTQISKDWIAQRIQGLSLGQAIRHALLRTKRAKPATLIEEFIYPKLGIGELVNNLALALKKQTISAESCITRINHDDRKITKMEMTVQDREISLAAEHFISTIPITTLVRLLQPAPPADVMESLRALKSRDLILVTLFLNKPRVTPENWIYFPGKDVPFGRFHEPKNWSECMAPRGKSSIVTEHFCFHTDDIWKNSESDLIDKTVESLCQLKLIERKEVDDAVVLKIKHAYPLFDLEYLLNSQKVMNYLHRFTNLSLAGRTGSFRYYNIDQAMLSGINTAEKICKQKFDYTFDQSESSGNYDFDNAANGVCW